MSGFFDWVQSFWWTVFLSMTFSFGLVSYWFDRIIKKEMDRGGEEYGERATTKIQKITSIVMVSSIVLSFGVIILKTLLSLGWIHFGS